MRSSQSRRARSVALRSWRCGSAPCRPRPFPTASRPLVAVFAANHGVAARGVSPYPDIGDCRHGGEFRSGWGRHQPDLRPPRPRPQGVRTGARDPDSRHHGRAPAHRRGGLRRHHRLRHGGDSRHRSSLRWAKWGSAIPRSRRPSTPHSSAARSRQWVGRGTGVDDAGYARKVAVVEEARGAEPGSPPRRPAGGFAPARRPRGRRHGGGHLGGADRAHSGDSRRLRGLRGRRGAPGASIPHGTRPLRCGPPLRRRRAWRGACAGSERSRCSISGLRLGEGTGAALAAGIVRSALACPHRHGDLRSRPAWPTRTEDCRL